MARIHHGEFRSQGEKLAIGKQIRLNHRHCPAGTDTRQRLYVKRTHDAVLAYCHNCGGHGIVGIGKNTTRAIRDLLIEHEAAQRNEHGELVLPDDIDLIPERWPTEAQAWVFQYGINGAEAAEYSLGYSQSWGRVILPVYEGGKLVFWQGRAVHKGQDPKYISAKTHPKVMFYAMKQGKGGSPAMMLVEDMLSAIKMSRFSDTIAFLGTSPDFDCLTERLQGYTKVGIFLDPDRAGHTKAIDLERRLSLVYRGKVSRICSHVHQPKEMDNSALAAIVSGL